MSQAKDKAKELVQEFYKWIATPDDRDIEFYKAKQCALIFVDGVLQEIPKRFDSEERYWEEVKNEIEKL